MDCYILSWRLPNNQLITNHDNTMVEAKGMTGRDWSDKAVQNDTKFCTFKTIEDSSKPHKQKDISQGTKTFGPEDINAMVLTRKKEVAEAFF